MSGHLRNDRESRTEDAKPHNMIVGSNADPLATLAELGCFAIERSKTTAT